MVMSERVFIGDNNHGFRHSEVPILQQPNQSGRSDCDRFLKLAIGAWPRSLRGITFGRNTVVGSNSVVKGGKYPSHAVIASPPAEVLFRRHNDGE